MQLPMRVLTQQIWFCVTSLCLILSLGSLQHLFCQNLIPNPGFEITGTVPCGWTTSASAFSDAVADWTMPSNGTPDVHATFVGGNCWNAQPASNYAGWDCWRGGTTPRTGNTMIGLFTVANAGSWREYLQVKFTSPMVPGQSYDIGFYVCLANSSSLATNNLGIHLSTSPISGSWGHMTVTPQIVETNIVSDTSNWTWVGGTIVATSAFEYITIGNFSTNANTDMQPRSQPCDGAYYFIDDACVSLSSSSSCGQILDPQILNFSAETDQDHTVACTWETGSSDGISHFLLQRSGDGIAFDDLVALDVDQHATSFKYLDVTPLNGMSYYRLMQVDLNGQQYFSKVQEVRVSPGPRLQIYPNPSSSRAPHLSLDQIDGEQVALQIVDVQGKTHYTGTHSLQQGHLELDLGNLLQLGPGMYIVSCKTPSSVQSSLFFVN